MSVVNTVSSFFNRYRYGKGTPSLKAVISRRQYFSRSEGKLVDIKTMHDHHLANAILKMRREIDASVTVSSCTLKNLSDLEIEAAVRGFDVY